MWPHNSGIYLEASICTVQKVYPVLSTPTLIIILHAKTCIITYTKHMCTYNINLYEYGVQYLHL